MKLPSQRVLLVEDNDRDYAWLRDLFSTITSISIEIVRVKTIDEAALALEQGQYDVCLLNYHLHDRTGLELLQTSSIKDTTPIIILTDDENYEVDVAAAKAGALDYQVKDHLNAPLLERSIRYAIQHQQTVAALRRSEERYRAFIGNSTEAIWCCEMREPVSTSLPEDEQIDHFYKYSYLSECNEAMSQLYGFSSPQEIVGAPLDSLVVRDNPENIEYLRALIRSGYRLYDAESCEVNRHGETKYFLNNLIGIIENGYVQRVWGTQRDITERREAELMRSQLAAIVESSEDAIISKTLEGIITTWNRGAQNLYGYTAAEAIGQPISLIVPPELSGEILHLRQIIKSGASVQQHETIRVSRDGTRLNISLSIAPLRNAEGQIVGDSTIQRDITQRKRNEDALRQKDALLRIAGRITSTGGWAIEVNEGNVFWSDEIFDLLEYPKGNAPSLNEVLNLHPAPSRDNIAAALKVCADNGTPFDTEVEIHTATGRRLWVRMSGEAERNSDGSIKCVQGAMQDISEQRKNAEALRVSNERFNILSQATNDTIWDWNLQTDKLWWNEGFETLFGYRRDELESSIESWTSRIDPADLKRILNDMHTALDGGKQHWVGEYRFRKADGTYAFIYDRGLIIRDARNQPVRVVGSMQDITERKQVEEALRTSEEKFQSIVANVPGMVYQFTRHVDASIEWPFVSEGCRNLFEVDAEAIKRNPQLPLDMVHPDDRGELDRTMKIAEKNLSPWSWEGRFRLPSGQTKWVQGASYAQRLPDGGAICTGLLVDITARKEAEQERDRFFTMSLDMLCIAGFDGYFKRVNPALIETLGYSEEELMSEPFIRFIHPDDREATQRIRKELATGRHISNFTNRYQRKDGEWRWFEWKTVADLEDGTIYAVARDITERKEAETALRRMHDELEVRVQERTAALEESNVALQQEIGKREQAMQEIRSRTRQQEAVSELGRRALTNIDLDVLFSDAIALISTTLEAEVCSILEILPDTDELLVRAAVGMPEDKIGQARISSSPDTPAGYTMRTGEPVIITNLHEETQFCPAPLAIQQGIISSMNVLIRSDEKPFGVVCIGSIHGRLFTRDDVHCLQSMANILAAAVSRNRIETEIRQLNAQLEETNEQLRIENVERQIALGALRETTQTLKEAKEEAEQARENAEIANRAKSEFLSRMSHELRTPLNAILGFGQILEIRNQDADLQEKNSIQQILKGGRHLLNLINEILDIARIEAGHLSLSPEPVTVAWVIREALDLVRPLAESQNIRLIDKVQERDDLPPALADQQRLKQVLLNLLSNAVKYNRPYGTVIIDCEIIDSGTENSGFDDKNEKPRVVEYNGVKCEGALRVRVEDTGFGLNKGEVARLFVPFERLGANRTQIEGTGIGLSLCKHLVEAMHGHIDVESEPGRGSIFWFEIPLIKEATALPSFEASISNSRNTTEIEPIAESSRTILYIEDNLSNINLIEHVLSDLNQPIRLLTAMQGSLGLELAAQHRPDLILLDVHLPDIMGDIVLNRLKINSATQHIPVVALSADATVRQKENLLSLGAVDYLTKPLDIEQFLATLRQTLNGSIAIKN